MRPLVVSSCQAVCIWSPTDVRLDDLPVFACEGCGSEWVRTEAWTPIGYDGQVPAAVRAERSLTSGRSADAAGSGDSGRTSGS